MRVVARLRRTVLGPVAQLAVADRRSCALTVAGALRCWGLHIDFTSVPRGLPPEDLGPVVQVAVGINHSCAVTVSGRVRCWGGFHIGQSEPPDDLEQVAQVGVGDIYSCALTTSGELRCWGSDSNGRRTPPNDLGPDGVLGPVVQLGVGESHSCALTVEGRVRCWGSNTNDRATPPDDLGPVVQLSVGLSHACALTVSGGLRCWGDVADIASLPPGAVTAVDFYGVCALLADGSVVCPGRPQLVPPEQRAGDVVMAVWPQRLNPGERAAIRFADLRETTTAFTARIEVFGGGAADVSSYYRLLSSNGQPVEAETDANSGNSANSVLLTGNPPMAWLEASGTSRFSRLYVRPLELLSASDSTPSIRVVAQSVELIDGLSFTASTDTLTEGGEAAQLSIVLPAAHAGLPLELELAIGGTALAGSDYTLVAAPAQGIVLGGEATDEITLRVESIPAEPLRLLLRQRAADSIYQGQRSLTLQISRYQVVPEGGATVDLPPVLDFIILDDEPLPVQQLQVEKNGDFACVLLSDRSLRCAGSNTDGRSTPPPDLGPVAQLAVGELHACAVTVGGRVRCWGNNDDGQAEPPDDLPLIVQVGVGTNFSCARLLVSRELRCWGNNDDGRSDPPDELSSDEVPPPFTQLAVGNNHSCVLNNFSEVDCWGNNDSGQSDQPDNNNNGFTQFSVGANHNCALSDAGLVHCWGLITSAALPGDPPGDLGPIAQLASSDGYSCAVTISGELHCWGNPGFTSPPAELGPDGALGPVAQVGVNRTYACALTVGGTVRCWGNSVPDDIPSLPPGSVTTIDASGRCMVLAEGSVVCPGRPQLAPPELRPGDVVMGVSPQRLNPGAAGGNSLC